MRPLDLNSLLPRRVRILWLVLGALLLVSILPIALYHHQVLRLSQDKLEDTERVQQIELTRSMAEQVQLFESTLRQQLISERQILALTGLSDNVNDPANVPKVARLLQTFVESTPNVLYVMAVGTDAKGGDAGDFGVKRDPFVGKALQRAFMTTEQLLESHSDPLALDPDNRPGLVMAVPLEVNGRFSGMLAAVVSLDSILSRLKEASAHDRSVFIVDHAGHIVAHSDSKTYFPGTDFSTASPLVAKIRDLPPDFRDTETVRFNLKEGNRTVPMMGAYSTMPELNWAVISQRSLEKARDDAGVSELNNQALSFVIVVSFAALILGYLFAVGISTPIRRLAQSTHAISRGEFHERTPVPRRRGNQRAGRNLQQHGRRHRTIHRAAEAGRARESRTLPGLDPHARRGHRRKGSLYARPFRSRREILAHHGRELNLTEKDLDRLRISALLHDVGKIGVDDRVLKKPGALTPEEFEFMKQHPTKGANIMRPGRAAQGHAARHRVAPRTRGRPRLPVRPARATRSRSWRASSPSPIRSMP